jgi:transcription elongation factor Elf1
MTVQKLDSRPHQLLLTCPNCFQPMRIAHIEVDSGRERVVLACQACNIEATCDSPPRPSLRTSS